MIRVGVDAGGTFTDFIAVGPGWQRSLKLPSRPADPAGLVRDALELLVGDEAQPVELVFSTTVATNALLERRGGPCLLVTTAGMEDVLEIGRQARPVLYALEPILSRPLLSEDERIGVAERVAASGEIVRALDEAELDRVVAAVRERDPSMRAHVAVCLLHSYVEPAHEQMIGARLRELGWRVVLSSEICPLPREYERTSTTVIDAYVGAVLGDALASIASDEVALRVMESSGGARAAHAGNVVRPARTVLSGPAAGALAAERIARRHHSRLALALDMGGTSTDLALVRDGHAARVDELLLDGLPLALPSVSMRCVGAGGGSIAWIDEGGALKVGPRSAGATPGPACYARGGAEATVTDAQVVLGRVGRSLCGGTMRLDQEAAHTAVGRIAAALGTPVEVAAHAIVEVAEAAIIRAARLATLGEVPELLIAYGGAAGLHAVSVARALGIARVVVPVAPGLACAVGALYADVVVEAIAAWRRPLDGAAQVRFEALLAEVEDGLDRDEVPRGARSIERTLRARYVGQGIDGELELPMMGFDADAFHRAHEAAYGHRLDRAVEVVSLRVRGAGIAPPLELPVPVAIGWDRVGTRVLAGAGGAPVYARDRLRSGRCLVGPALVEDLSATLYLPPGASATRLPNGDLLIVSTEAP